MKNSVNNDGVRKRNIRRLVILIHALMVIWFFYVNGWFLRDVPVKNETAGEDVTTKDRKEQKQRIDRENINIPPLQAFKEDAMKEVSEAVVPKEQLHEKKETPFPASTHMNREQTETVESGPRSDEAVIGTTEDLVSPSRAEKTDPLSSNDECPHPFRPTSEENIADIAEKEIDDFDFNEYQDKLLRCADLKDGEQTPVLRIDDHNNREIYKAGLKFYGYQLIGVPKKNLRDPYYYTVTEIGISLINEKCPYTGGFEAHTEDHELFRRLLSGHQSRPVSLSDYELFYAPMDSRMQMIVKSKLKLITGKLCVAIEDISGVLGSFRRVGRSYVIIIESVLTKGGSHLGIDDPDAKIQDSLFIN